MLKIGSLAKEWAARYGTEYESDYPPSLICCFPGNKISTNKFKYQSMNSSLSLKIAPNGGGGSRFLVFVICLVVDLTHCRSITHVVFTCEYQLTATDGGNGGGGYEKLENDVDMKVERCGVHVFYVDAESDTVATDGTNDTDATEKRHAGNKEALDMMVKKGMEDLKD
ncbi:hypothetical protein GOBAR_AA28586 [Gossypium barbadense]|uniref:C-JID domain-containing protein n=1 Tax=Gossypium barbadense TaxID=3634 RepID=A0A2P5WLX7_GOSBA|nr:hypothetical protein GOBAR_AA28586 [Gossypium barbadense]